MLQHAGDFSTISQRDEQEFKEASEDLLKLSGRDHKFTQPMCISSFEEFNIIVFALANRQVILYEVKQTG